MAEVKETKEQKDARERETKRIITEKFWRYACGLETVLCVRFVLFLLRVLLPNAMCLQILHTNPTGLRSTQLRQQGLLLFSK
jgi:hypothetical protein